MTTQCVVAEIRALGPDFAGTAIAVRRLEMRRCPHTGKPVDAATCLSEIIGQDNKHRYCVATQDGNLRKKFRQVPGTPLILISKNVMVLEHLSSATEKKIKEMEQAKTVPVEFEKKVLKAEGLDIEPEKGEEPVKKKRKKKQPNPLSVKKPKKKPEDKVGSVKEKKGPRKESEDIEMGADGEEAGGEAAGAVADNNTEQTEQPAQAKKKRPRKPRNRRKKKAAAPANGTAGHSGSDSDWSSSDSDSD